MLCPVDIEKRTVRAISKQIDKDLKNARRKLRTEKKLLLLGTGEAGKTTFIKQMRIIHGSEYDENEILEFKKIIFQNIYDGICKLGDAMETLNISYNSTIPEALLNEIFDVTSTGIIELPSIIPAHHVVGIQKFWSDEGIQECFRRRSEFQLIDSSQYFLDNIVRISQPGYKPSIDDILRSRKATTGIQEYPFDISNITFRMVDVGGQKSERRKWIHCFEGVDAVMYLAAISEFDQFLAENESQNRLEESLNLFNTIIHYPWFLTSPIILFLNKTDLLKEKLEISNLADTWPDFKGPQRDDKAAREFIYNMFSIIWKQNQVRSNVYHHYTQATDTKNIEIVFEIVKNEVLLRNIHEVIPGIQK
eukprot:TRINITY_DN2926_c1_g1_i1.p1 TRINITY_DN2926_c1_g1~~TRINITY_DN2926_c1_g1_i1.p1  ORF type:complete len:363 (-),score=30.95 TRINITY_DN2926_c1_g1_i1:111-1199(-)